MTTLDSVSVPQQRLDLGPLRARLTGEVHEPHEDVCGQVAMPWNVAVPMAPVAGVVAARTAQDVVATVRFAREHGLTVGVQATGHGAVSSLAGHLLVSTRGLDELTIHPQGWARVGAGVKWARVTEAAAPHGLTGLCGSTGDVGVVGYTTGGGIGPMSRTYGLAADRVRAFDVVTGDGELRRVTPTEHPELFFALRGGKGAGGIVTAVEFDLVPLTTFYGGAVYFDGADAAAVVERWRTWSETLPEQGTTSFALLQLPEAPMVPPVLAGRLTLAIRFLWTGDAEQGARLLDEVRAAAPAILDDASVRPVTAVDSVHCDPVDPMPSYERTALLREFPEQAARALLDAAGAGSGSPQVVVEVRQLGGALAREGEHPCALAHRDGAYNVLTVGIPFDPRVAPHAGGVLAALAEWDTGRAWPNFAPPHDEASARRAYDDRTLARLAEVSRAYDPDGVLAAARFAQLF